MKFDKQQTIVELKKEFDENLGWVEPLLRQGEDSRFIEVQKALQFVVDRFDESTGKLTDEIPQRELFLSSIEARNFNRAVDFLRSLNPSHLPRQKIQRMCRGPIYHSEEASGNESTEGRDIQFEFILSELMTRSGMNIFGHDDIEFTMADSTIQYECKRPWFLKNFKQKFDQAVNQLGGKLAQKKNAYGIIALSVDKFKNLENRLFHGDDYRGVFKELLAVKTQISDNLRNNLKLSSEKRIIGVHFYLKTAIWDAKSGGFVEVYMSALEKVVHEKKYDLLDNLYEALVERIQVE